MACTLLSVSAVSVQDSQAYRNMDMTRERISLIFELSAIFLSFQMVLSLASAAVAWAILARISGLDPSTAMIAPRYLNLLTQSSFLPLTLMSGRNMDTSFFLQSDSGHTATVWVEAYSSNCSLSPAACECHNISVSAGNLVFRGDSRQQLVDRGFLI